MAGLPGLASHGGGSPSNSWLQLLILPISHQTESNWQKITCIALGNTEWYCFVDALYISLRLWG